MDPGQLIEEAMKVKADAFTELVNEVKSILAREEGRVGELVVSHGFMEPPGSVLVPETVLDGDGLSRTVEACIELFQRARRIVGVDELNVLDAMPQAPPLARLEALL